ncbi:MAG: DNA-3-methyladenine glycosylase 2 family protein [Planctomycetes bacterium]|nr:DNA-3-methyladenine glycosylase 2 family protein [Planctomycetota bacterium]
MDGAADRGDRHRDRDVDVVQEPGVKRAAADAPPLTPATLSSAVATLATRDRDLAAVVERCGAPPMWARRPGFATLVRIILEQQVSLASGAAAYRRLSDAVGRVTPARVLRCPAARLRGAGVTRQKTRYCRGLARAVTEGTLDLATLNAASPESVRDQLTAITGIGPWTADVYALMALRHPDIWPPGDVALVTALRDVKPRATGDIERIVEAWRPWRAVAARVLWHHYLCRKGRGTARSGSGGE